MATTVSINRGRIGPAFAFDATVEEKHDDTAVATEFPVEAGATISDHVKQNPFRLTLTGIVGDAPVFLDDTAMPVVQQRPRKAYDMLRAVKAAGQAVDVVTSLGTYESMVIESVAVSKSSTTGTALSASVSMKQINIVASSTVIVQAPKVPRNKATTKEGPATGTVVAKPTSLFLDGARKLAQLGQQDATIAILAGGN